MLSVTVGRVRNRYRGVRDEGDRLRLDRVVRDTLPPALEAALALAGVQPWEDVCIGHLHVSARLANMDAEHAMAAGWSTAVADAVRARLEHGGEGVVRFPGRVHTLLDIVRGVSAGSLERAWAWRGLGLWPAGADADPSRAAADALLSEPTAVAPVLAEAARAPEALVRFLAALPEDTVEALARSALAAAGVADLPDRDDSEADFTAGRELPSGGPRPPGPRGGEERGGGGRVAGASAVADGVTETVARFLRSPSGLHRVGEALAHRSPRLGGAMAVLALTAWDPAALVRAASPEALVEGVVDAWTAAAGGGRRGGGRSGPRGTAPTGDSGGVEAGVAAAARSARSPFRSGVETRPNEAARRASETPSDALPVDRRRARPRPTAAAGDGDPGAGATVEPPAAEAAGWSRRREGTTGHGGLLLLLGTLDATGIAERLLAEAGLAHASTRWVLHALARRLADVEPDDPAALAFCGLRPGAELPEEGRTAAREEERHLGHAADALREALGPALGRPTEPLTLVELAGIVRREARIVCDPGWTEVRFPLESADVRLRRAGLDRDPGWVPWLGVVVRYVYA